MLTTRRCPRTGVLNFFEKHDPYIAVATVVPLADGFIWHYHGDGPQPDGLAAALATAAQAIKTQYRQAIADEAQAERHAA